MRIFSFSTLKAFYETHTDAEDALRSWYKDATAANWSSPNEIKAYAGSVSLLSNERVCFNIKGNTYRLVVGLDYTKKFIYVKFVGTHAEYDKIDAETVQFGEVAR